MAIFLANSLLLNVAHILAINQYFPRILRNESTNHRQNGTFPSTIWTDKRRDFPFLNFKDTSSTTFLLLYFLNKFFTSTMIYSPLIEDR